MILPSTNSFKSPFGLLMGFVIPYLLINEQIYRKTAGHHTTNRPHLTKTTSYEGGGKKIHLRLALRSNDLQNIQAEVYNDPKVMQRNFLIDVL